MKYKCIAKCFVEDTIIMKPGDIVVIEGNKFFNVTTGVDYHNVSDMARLKVCLEAITDESPQKANFCSSAIFTPPTDADKFEAITKKMHSIFRKKNHDYGNSFEQSLNEEGLAASRIRMGDKWNRYKTLSKPRMDAQVNDESLRDTLLDLANYAIMTVMWLDKQKCDSGGR